MEEMKSTEPEAEKINCSSADSKNYAVSYVNPKSNIVGICALVFGILSIFLLTIVFMPIALILAIIALVKKQYVWGICALITCIIAIYTSPTVWLLFNIWKNFKAFREIFTSPTTWALLISRLLFWH